MVEVIFRLRAVQQTRRAALIMRLLFLCIAYNCSRAYRIKSVPTGVKPLIRRKLAI